MPLTSKAMSGLAQGSDGQGHPGTAIHLKMLLLLLWEARAIHKNKDNTTVKEIHFDKVFFLKFLFSLQLINWIFQEYNR